MSMLVWMLMSIMRKRKEIERTEIIDKTFLTALWGRFYFSLCVIDITLFLFSIITVSIIGGQFCISTID